MKRIRIKDRKMSVTHGKLQGRIEAPASIKCPETLLVCSGNFTSTL